MVHMSNHLLNDLINFGAKLERKRKIAKIESDSYLFALSNKATASPIETPGLTTPLWAYQTAAVEYAARTRFCIIADQMRLGKTPSAIATLLHIASRRALVICPPHLKLNWLAEYGVFAKGKTVHVINGVKPYELPFADVYIIGDAQVAKWAAYLTTFGLDAVVADEAHRFKSQTAARSKAVVAIADTIPAHGAILLLTGTPVVNRPNELVNLLRIIRRIEEVFGGARGFLQKFCVPEEIYVRHLGRTIVKYDKADPRTIGELNTLLRGTCMIRRTRDQVWANNPGKVRTNVFLTLNGALKEYDAAARNFIAYVRATKGAKAASIAERAEIIAQMTTLRNLVGKAKIKAAIEYVQDILDQDEQVVVFGWHREVLEAIAAHFNAPMVLGGVSAEKKDAAVRAFQSGAARVIVGNISSMGTGLTLAASCNLVMVEQAWTPGDRDQAEDRIVHAAQSRTAIVHTLLAAGTFDEHLAKILAGKTSVTTAVIDGGVFKPSAIDETSIMLELADRMAS